MKWEHRPPYTIEMALIIILSICVMVTGVLAQEPSEAVKKAALMRAYHLNGDSMVGSRMIDMSSVDVTDPNVECFMIPGEVQTSFDCRQKIEAPKPKAKAPKTKLATAADVEVPAPKPDICRRHGLRKVTEGKSWRCRR